MPDDSAIPDAKDNKEVKEVKEPDEREKTAFDVARMVLDHGYAVGKIAKTLFPEDYESKTGQSRAIMRVKRALQHAVHRGILKLTPLPHEELAARLRDRYGWIDNFSVVHDEAASQTPFDDTSVFLVAAREIAHEIHQLALRKKDDHSIVIANAGGFTLSRVVHYLASEAIVPENGSRLKFISLNAARKADAYQISANFLAVRMSEIYGGKHIAVLPVAPKGIQKQYEEALGQIDLLISSAGTRKGFLWLWYDEVYRKEFSIPKEVVGDLAFVPIDQHGNKVDLPGTFGRTVEKQLKPRPCYEDLQSLANKGKVMVVCARLSNKIRNSADENSANARARVTKAILERGLASKCILGTSVARGVLEG